MVTRHNPGRIRYRRCLYLISILLVFGMWILSSSAVHAAPGLGVGAQVFQTECAGCHVGGDNIIRRGKNLKLKALEKNHVDSVETITALVVEGKGNMSAYGDKLTVDEITAVAEYVLAQAQNNWQ